MSQQMDALARANEIRLAARDVKHEVTAGALSITDALADPRARSLKVRDLLMAQVGWGPTRVDAACGAAFVAEYRRVRELTPGKLDALAEACDPVVEEPLDPRTVLPIGPFRDWLTSRFPSDVTVGEMAAGLGVNQRTLRRWLYEAHTIQLGTVDDVLTVNEGPDVLRELYPLDDPKSSTEKAA